MPMRRPFGFASGPWSWPAASWPAAAALTSFPNLPSAMTPMAPVAERYESPSCDVLHGCVADCLGCPLTVITDWQEFYLGLSTAARRAPCSTMLKRYRTSVGVPRPSSFHQVACYGLVCVRLEYVLYSIRADNVVRDRETSPRLCPPGWLACRPHWRDGIVDLRTPSARLQCTDGAPSVT